MDSPKTLCTGWGDGKSEIPRSDNPKQRSKIAGKIDTLFLLAYFRTKTEKMRISEAISNLKI